MLMKLVRKNLQQNVLPPDGREKIFEDCLSGARADSPEPQAVLAFIRPGDIMIT